MHPLWPKQKETEYIEEDPPKEVMDRVGVDIFQIGSTYFLFFVDEISGYPWVHSFPKSPKTLQVVRALSDIFLLHWYPKCLRADGGGQFRHAFETFCTDASIKFEQSSPYHPQSNGLAECNLASLKTLIKK